MEDADYWQLDFLGFLPGKRESRRMVGDYIMTQGDVLSGGHFDDIAAFGGWPLDDHHPDGFYHYGNPNVWGRTPAPYGIPYRCLYSKNIANLFFAGRNISLTHAAMSSARVMATCATLGEAVGTAANIAREFDLSPRGVYEEQLSLLKARLMENGCFLPYNKREIPAFLAEAELTEGLDHLRNGIDRTNHTYGPDDQGASFPLGQAVGYTFAKPQKLENIHIAFDPDLDRATLPGDSCERRHSMRANIVPESPTMIMPKTLAKSYIVTGTKADGETVTLYADDCNLRYCVNIPAEGEFTALTITVNSLWNNDDADTVHMFSFDAR
ncbi:MAG: FAD-dependent oxidoreductase [Clostridia bacterium]|nr:FAD-dependent oxidoreductase [Clostridia bacterium]